MRWLPWTVWKWEQTPTSFEHDFLNAKIYLQTS